MLKELQPFILFLYWETVPKNQRRRDSEQACLCVCLGFIACPERAPKHCPTTGASMSRCSSQRPSFAQKGNQVNSSPPLFFCRAAHLSPCTQPIALAREWQGLSHGCSCLLSTLLQPLIAWCIRPTAPLSPPQPKQCSAGGTWAEGQRERRKVEGHTPFSLLQSGARAVTPYPGRIFTSCSK